MGYPRPRGAEGVTAARSGSSAAPEAAAVGGLPREAATHSGPGEERHLTHVGRQYATGSAGEGLGPKGRKTCPACLAASGGFGAQPQGFRLSRENRKMRMLPAGQARRAKLTASSSAQHSISSIFDFPALLTLIFRPARTPQYLRKGNKCGVPESMRVSGLF